ncbi:hypothetical protein J6590_102079 [Homalodisca vitripennis]|nr:hypothetical protein J6590_102079 [Homalodisca vitripennis]
MTKTEATTAATWRRYSESHPPRKETDTTGWTFSEEPVVRPATYHDTTKIFTILNGQSCLSLLVINAGHPISEERGLDIMNRSKKNIELPNLTTVLVEFITVLNYFHQKVHAYVASYPS